MLRAFRLFNAAWAFLAVIGAAPTVQAALALRLSDGSRVSVGEVVTSDTETLTVANSAAGVRIERTLSWERVAGADLEGEAYTREELRLALGVGNGEPEVGNGEWGMGNGDAGGGRGPTLRPPVVPVAFPPTPGPGCPCGMPVTAPYPLFPEVGRVIGVRPDPLAAYEDLIPLVYPNGVPSTEVPFALAVLRERRRLEAIAPIVGPGAWPGPLASPAGGPIPMAGPNGIPPMPGLP